MADLFDNIDKKFIDGLKNSLRNLGVKRADFCVGYFNIRGWDSIAETADGLCGETLRETAYDEQGRDTEITALRKCRLLVGMHNSTEDSLRRLYASSKFRDCKIDTADANRLIRKTIEDFKKQLTLGILSKNDEKAIRKLIEQLDNGTVVVKLFLRHQLHAKLYLAYRPEDSSNPIIPILGSSNLTWSGLQGNGELDTEIPDKDNGKKLKAWFEDKWQDKFCIDITKELLQLLNESWASPKKIPPHHIYLKVAYHLCREARLGMYEYELPEVFTKRLFDFQATAVKIAAHNLDKRGGAMIGDVVGLGKTITACAVAKVYEMRNASCTLILCPANLQTMWQNYVKEYDLKADVMSIEKDFDPEKMRYYKLLIIDESHNLRNSEGKRYKRIRALVNRQNCKTLLLTATPYNKDYRDLSNQLKLFIPEDADLGIKPEACIRKLGDDGDFFTRYSDIFIRSIRAFEKSEESDDWRDLMRLFLVRRTRTFIKANYAKTDKTNGRKYLVFSDGTKSYFPDRVPKAVKFKTQKGDQFERLYSDDMLKLLGGLKLPRYGLESHLDKNKTADVAQDEKQTIDNLTRAGTRMMGFCRTTLMKRLDSSGVSFLISVYRHILRNAVYLYAIKNGREIPIGDGGNLPDDFTEEDDLEKNDLLDEAEGNAAGNREREFPVAMETYFERAAAYYNAMKSIQSSRVSWLPCKYFKPSLEKHLTADCETLLQILKLCGTWKGGRDQKLNTLQELVCETHKDEKCVVFTQFSDTAHYIADELEKRGVAQVAVATGESENPTALAERFSPESNQKDVPENEQVRVLVATDVLSEGQNLQDSHIIINYDLPWAIIRLVQRAGRVDRIGQKSDKIYCYSFFPADGVEAIINLRKRLNQRINENAETVGSDEIFFEGNAQNLSDLYNEKSGVLDDDDENGEVDLASQAYQIWKSALDKNPGLEKTIANMSDGVYSAKAAGGGAQKEGVVTYARTPDDNDILTWMDADGNVITQSQLEILNALRCEPDEPHVKPLPNHLEIVQKSIEKINAMDFRTSGSLGSRFSTKYQVYTKLNNFFEENKGGLFEDEKLKLAVDDIYQYPLKEKAKVMLGSMIRGNEYSTDDLAKRVKELRDMDELCIKDDEELRNRDPETICSMGIVGGASW